MHSYLLTFASRNKQSFHTFMKLCTTQTKNTNTVNLLITSTHIHVASTVLPRARSVPYPCTASRINHFQHHQSIIDTERQREREREREIDTTNRMRHRQVPFNDKTIGGSHTHNHTLMFVARVHLSIRQEIHRQYNPRSCAARPYCGALSSSTRHKYLLGCMILSWTRSASSQGNHIDDSSSSHSPSAEMVVTHR